MRPPSCLSPWILLVVLGAGCAESRDPVGDASSDAVDHDAGDDAPANRDALVDGLGSSDDAAGGDAGVGGDADLDAAGLDAAGLDAGTPGRILSASEIGEAICAFRSACEPPDRRPPLSNCMSTYTQDDWISEISEATRARAASVVPCLLEATTCDAYEACIRGDEECTESRCDGDVLVGCESNGFAQRRDCAAEGLNCVESEDPPTCSLAGAAPCGRDEFACEGDVFLWCPIRAQVVPFATNCAESGKTCDTVCVDSPITSCSETTCSDDGTEIIYCVGGSESSFQCDWADPDYRCFVPPGGEATCGIPEPACSEDDRGRCEDGVAVICDGGKEYEFDCERIGAVCTLESGPRCIPESEGP
ncbi:MAG: hypothetical protein AB8H86_05915 [Polyangiales bacterium]